MLSKTYKIQEDLYSILHLDRIAEQGKQYIVYRWIKI